MFGVVTQKQNTFVYKQWKVSVEINSDNFYYFISQLIQRMGEWKVPEELDKALKEVGVGLRSVDDPYFEESHRMCGVFQRLGIIFVDEEEFCHPVMKEFTCNALGCNEKFQTLVEYEMHYNGYHRYVCMECKKVRPSPKLLDIHIQETHDSFFKVTAEKQSMYQCFLSDCNLKFPTPEERKQHCIKIHKFPKNYRFDETMREKSSKQMKESFKMINRSLLEESMEVSSPQKTHDSIPEAKKLATKSKKSKKKEENIREICEDSMEAAPSQTSEQFCPPGEKSEEKIHKKGRRKSKKGGKTHEDSMETDVSGKFKTNARKPNLYKNQKVRTFIPNLENCTKSPNELANEFPVAETLKNPSTPSSSVLAFIPRQLIYKPTPYSKILTKEKRMEKAVLETNTMMDLVEALSE